jgi:hypothetical protein
MMNSIEREVAKNMGLNEAEYVARKLAPLSTTLPNRAAEHTKKQRSPGLQASINTLLRGSATNFGACKSCGTTRDSNGDCPLCDADGASTASSVAKHEAGEGETTYADLGADPEFTSLIADASRLSRARALGQEDGGPEVGKALISRFTDWVLGGGDSNPRPSNLPYLPGTALHGRSTAKLPGGSNLLLNVSAKELAAAARKRAAG